MFPTLQVTDERDPVVEMFILKKVMDNVKNNIMFIGPCIIVIVEEWKTNLMSLAILFHFLCA